MITGDAATAALARVDRLHSALTHLVLEGGDLGQIADEVTRVMDVGLMFTSTDGRVTADSLAASVRERLVRHDLFDPTGRFRVERLRTGEEILPGTAVVLLRIAAGGADLGRLACFRTGTTISEEDVHALERAAAVAALLITREQAVSAVENKYRGDFLRDVFLRRAGDGQYVIKHAAGFGWDLTRPAVVVSAEIDPPGADEEVSNDQQRQWQERFARAWRQVSHDIDPGIASVDFSSEVVTLLAVPPQPSSPSAAVAPPGYPTVGRAVTGVAGDRGGGRRRFTVGVSRIANSWQDLPTAYAQARRALEVGRRVHGGGTTTYFDQLGVHRLIALVPDERELRSFAHDVLGVLADDTAEAHDLRATLQVLLDTNFNVAEASRQQFFHYNTMRYRVGKLERLLGPLASDPNLRLDVAVALRVLEITG